jgi:hypothetical protein
MVREKRPTSRQEPQVQVSNREHIRQSMQADVLTALTKQGVDARQAVEWCDLWEAETARQGITHVTEYFWDAAKGWIDAHRNSRTPL